MEEKEASEISYWSDKKLWVKAIVFSSISLLAVMPIYLLLKKLEKIKNEKKKEKEEDGKEE